MEGCLIYFIVLYHMKKVESLIYTQDCLKDTPPTPLLDLTKLWDEGVVVFDGYQNDTFKLRAMLFCTINNFSAYRNLSEYSVKGHRACPICEEDKSYVQLKHGRKIIYILHQLF